MKPKDLKWPFTWEERCPVFLDQVLFVPEYYTKHQEWQMPSLFPNTNPMVIEYCSGNGSWVIEKAIAHPDMNWIAVEYQFERVRKIWAKMKNHNLSNLVIVLGEAFTFTQFYLPPNSINECYVNFPDPWPKKRHAKNRLIQLSFAIELARVVKPLGEALFVTDDLNYAHQMNEVMGLSSLWDNLGDFYADDYGTSYFDQLFRSKGIPIQYLKFQRKAV